MRVSHSMLVATAAAGAFLVTAAPAGAGPVIGGPAIETTAGPSPSELSIEGLVYIPLPGGKSFPFYDEFIPRTTQHVIADAVCTTDDFTPKVQDDVESAYLRLPGEFTMPDGQDPIRVARMDVLKEPNLSNASRHKLCKDPELMTKYNESVAKNLNKATFTYDSEFGDSPKERAALRKLWPLRITAYKTALPMYLKQGPDSI